MLIIVDKKAPAPAREKLLQLGTVVEFATQKICYQAISGHPDIFFFQAPEGLVIAPNTPEIYKQILRNHDVPFTEGDKPVGEKYPETAYYNALYTSFGIIHNRNVVDRKVRQMHPSLIHCKQAYVRCNALEVGSVVITSDKGVEKTLQSKGVNTLYVDSENIVLEGFTHGFWAGCCGISQKKLYICGSIHNMDSAPRLKDLLDQQGYEIIELYQGPLIDIGGILFVDTPCR